MAIAASTLVHDALLTLRGIISSGVTDPVTRASNESFIMTSYPQRDVKYPVVIIQDDSLSTEQLGTQTESQKVSMRFKVDVFATKVGYDNTGRDQVFDDVFNALRTSQIGVSPISGTQSYGLHNFKVFNTFNIDEPGVKGLHRKIMMFGYDYYISS